MLLASPTQDLFSRKLSTFACVKFADADLDLRAQFGQRFDAFEQFATELFLRRLRQRSGLNHRGFERFDHIEIYHKRVASATLLVVIRHQTVEQPHTEAGAP